MSELYLIALRLRTLSHILNETDYILSCTDDCDYPGSLIDLTADVLAQVAEDLERFSDRI